MKVVIFLLSVISSVLVSPITYAEERPRVLISTSLGEIEVELDAKNAPVTVANFLSYVDDGSYSDIIFHRVIPGFMIQGGGHYADMREAPTKETIRNEADNGLKNTTGTIAMARTNIIDSAARQFFINVNDNTNLDHRPDSCTREDESKELAAREKGLFRPSTCQSFGYAVFGRVVAGMEVVKKIESGATRTYMGHQNVPVVTVMINSIVRVSDNQE